MKLEGALTAETVNQNLVNIRYAVRGPVLERAEQIETELRKVLALVACPELMTSVDVPEDVKERARELLADCTSGSVGAYSPPLGLRGVRAAGAAFIAARDGAAAAVDDVIIGHGATDLIRAVLQLFVQDVGGRPPAVLVPVPQYPVFSGALAELGVRRADYLLDEGRGWALAAAELARAHSRAARDCHVRAIVVINPGNPTGQVLSRETIEEVVKFAYENKLFILADEVYQENIVSKQFHSFKKVMTEMGSPYSEMELASFLTLSKGWAAECGLRAGLLELRGVAGGVRRALGTARALAQCPNVLGQCALHCALRPPRPTERSYATWSTERRAAHAVLCARTAAACAAFNDIPGYSCNTIDGAMFAFPRVELPARAQAAAAARGLAPDDFYCFRLLEETGVCVVPGSGFGQAAGSFHLRVAVLLPEADLLLLTSSVRAFHVKFLLQYRDH